MNISPFYELRNRLYSSAASGCGTIGEDFRLKRAVEAFEPLAGANKAFMKLYKDCVRLLTSENPADILPDCIALADALAVTQGGFTEKTETAPSEIKSEMKIVPARYSVVSVLREKIEKCSPKLEELSSGETSLIADVRVLSSFIKASAKGNTYLDIFAEMVMSVWGKATVPPLKNAIDLTDEKASGKRVEYIFMAAGADENDYYVSLAKNTEAPKKIRISAIDAMSDHPANVGALIELSATEKNKIKETALMSLLKLDPPEAEDILAKIIEKSKGRYDKCGDYVRVSPSRTAEEFVRSQIMKISKAVRSGDRSKSVMMVESIVSLFRNKIGIADCFIEAAEISRLLSGLEQYGSDITSRLNDVLIKNLKNRDCEKFRRLISELYSKDSEKFYYAYFFMRFIDDPENAANELMEEMKKHHFETVHFLGWIRYDPFVGAYYTEYNFYNCNPTGYPEEKKNKTLFKSFPDSLLKFMCTTSAYDKSSSEGVCHAFEDFARGCSPEDKQRVNNAMFEFALEMGKKFPSFSGLDLMSECCPPEAGHRCKGMMTSYVLDSMKTERRVVYCYMIGQYPLSKEEKLAELNDLMKKVEGASDQFEKKLIDDQINYIKRVINSVKNTK